MWSFIWSQAPRYAPDRLRCHAGHAARRRDLGELVLAIKLGTPQKTLAHVIHPFPAFNRMLGESLNQLVSTVATEGEHHEQYARQL